MMRFVGIFCVFLLWDVLGYIAISEKSHQIIKQLRFVGFS